MKLGILGCGHVSDQYFGGISRSDLLEIVACADIDLARAEDKAAQHGVPRSCVPRQLFGDPEVELIVNLTPPRAHADASLAAIAAGKHVWSEKPLASNLDAARRVLEAAGQAGVLIGCAPDTFLGGSIQTAIKLIDDDWIGRPVSGVAFVSEHGYAPNGRLDERVGLPVSQVTSCCFGDEDLATLYVTSAARGTRGEPLAGSLFACRPGIRGLGATPFAG